MSEPAYAVEVTGLWTVFGSHVIHRDIDLRVKVGEVLGIIGSSGGGKTTLLREILGLQLPSRGTISVLGDNLTRMTREERNSHAQRCGVLFQDGALFSALSAFDNVALPLRELRWFPEELIADTVMLTLSLVGIEPESASKMPAELSGGMVKRVALARALVRDPDLLFLDEPTAGLDPDRSHGFVRLIQALRGQLGLTVVMITHDVNSLLALADRVAVLADQRLVTVGPLPQVVCYPHPFIRQFFLGQTERCTEHGIADYRARMEELPVPSKVE
jgi:phospholipid/cholesterol/gamma-HCH transport system ATP-binding protein